MKFTEIYKGTAYSVTVAKDLQDHLFRWSAQVGREPGEHRSPNEFMTAAPAMDEGMALAKSVIDRGLPDPSASPALH